MNENERILSIFSDEKKSKDEENNHRFIATFYQ